VYVCIQSALNPASEKDYISFEFMSLGGDIKVITPRKLGSDFTRPQLVNILRVKIRLA